MEGRERSVHDILHIRHVTAGVQVYEHLVLAQLVHIQQTQLRGGLRTRHCGGDVGQEGGCKYELGLHSLVMYDSKNFKVDFTSK